MQTTLNKNMKKRFTALRWTLASECLLCGRYMHLKFFTITILMVFSSTIQANDCVEFDSIENGSVSITADADKTSGMYHIRVPQKFNGIELRLLVLSATMKGSELNEEISLPLAIKKKGDLVGSYFYMPTNWLNVRVTATYGKNLCTELVAKLNT